MADGEANRLVMAVGKLSTVLAFWPETAIQEKGMSWVAGVMSLMTKPVIVRLVIM